MYFQVKSTLKHRNHTTTKHLYMFFTVHKSQPQFLPNMYLNLTNYTFLKLIFFKPQPHKLLQKQTPLYSTKVLLNMTPCVN